MSKPYVYIAMEYSEREEAEQWATKLRDSGKYLVSSCWHDPENSLEREGTHGQMAERDLDNLEMSDFLLIKTKPRGMANTNGRMFEAGYAASRGIEPFAVGPVENIFIGLLDENGQRFDTLDDFLKLEVDVA